MISDALDETFLQSVNRCPVSAFHATWVLPWVPELSGSKDEEWRKELRKKSLGGGGGVQRPRTLL